MYSHVHKRLYLENLWTLGCVHNAEQFFGAYLNKYLNFGLSMCFLLLINS